MSAPGFYALVVAAAAAMCGGGWYWIRAHRVTPEQRERQRRQRLTRMGRICDGTVLDVQEVSGNLRPTAQFIIYSYDVAGVSYEASQDITYLRQLVDVHSCRLGLPTSVRYDPQNPGNSIVISEEWNGLRT
jgi:hypothetical protein